MDPIIEFRDFTFKYRAQTEPTLRNIDLAIYPGEKILIAGPSGSGKSTIAHCLNALIPCSYKGEYTGSLMVGGKTPSEEGVFGMSKIVGTVLQDTDGQFIGMTVAEDLAFALENDAVPQDIMLGKVDEVADIVGMSGFLHHSPGELSGGQKQRVSLGGVLVDDVKILLFDEPLANLDPATGKKTIALIDDLMKREDLTVIIVEHRLEDVLYRDVDRIVVVSDGTIAADMRPDELLATDILTEHGIREPLYVTAVKHSLAAGGGDARISADDMPQHIETMRLEPYIHALRSWLGDVPAHKARPDAPAVLEIRDLSFGYDPAEPVLSDIDICIRKGEMLAIAGKNGAGKSTLASLISGFYKPTSGTILLNGEDIAPLSVKERGEHIGLVMQSPNQMISKPMIMEEVGLGLSVRGVDPEEVSRRACEALKICGLYPMRNWPVGALSYGQKKRVSIASILVMEPEIMILDEPTAGQDYRHYTEIMEFLKELNEKLGLTIIIITHDMHLMLEYTDRAIVLADGRLIADDTPARILTDEEITDRAYLKRTSLYDLALRTGVGSPDVLTQSFIDYERSLRQIRGGAQ